VERRQQRLIRLEQGDLRLREVELRELFSQRVVVDLTEGGDDLDPGRAAADDDDVERAFRCPRSSPRSVCVTASMLTIAPAIS
jgi:hypothetical protein